MLLRELHSTKSHINTFFKLRFELFQYEIAQFDVSFLQIVIVNDGVEVSWSSSVFELDLCRVQTLCESFLGLRVSFTQSILQLLDRWWLNKDQNRVEVRVSDLLNAFYLNIQHANLTVFLHILDCLFAKNKSQMNFFVYVVSIDGSLTLCRTCCH